ncbi:MAG: gamma-glutamylcyclotransferase family protein, partial [Victivallaceae bacterium]
MEVCGISRKTGVIYKMQNLILYLAYGSNMEPERMQKRCRGAQAIGAARLPNYRLTERLYADIDFAEGECVHGVLYLISERHLRNLDMYEGYPKIYRRMWLEVEFRGESYMALTYEMTPETKALRDGQ